MKGEEIKYDLIVVGGGPAGMICAGRAAERGARVLLLEKNPVLGKKLALTGGGRSNITNDISDVRALVGRYGAGGKPLFAAFSRFGAPEAINFFASHGLKTKTEAEGRVFPVSDDARDVIRLLAAYMKANGVRVVLNATVQTLAAYDEYVRVVSAVGEFRARAVAVAVGGLAYPETGSTGDGFAWLAKLGHKIITPDVSLVPVVLKEKWVAALSGISFPSVEAAICGGGKKIEAKKGKILFTHFGLSGPLILNMSKKIGETLKKGKTEISINFRPGESHEELEKEFLARFAENHGKKIKNVLALAVPEKIAAAMLKAAGVDADKFVNRISKTERHKIIAAVSGLRLTAIGLLGSEKAIVSSGGVHPAEVDFRTMRSKICPNVYILGDGLNFNRPSGGFSLQLCWTTGYLAGDSVVF